MQKREAEKNLANLIIPTTTYGSESSAHEHEQITDDTKSKRGDKLRTELVLQIAAPYHQEQKGTT